MFNEVAARMTLEARQQLRKEAALPPLDIDAELKTMREEAEQADATRAFEDWKANHPAVVGTIRQEVLNGLRAEWTKPADWQPTGILGGGRLWYETVVQQRLREAFRVFTARASRFVWGPDDVERH
jgi:hypothetical protein